MRLEINRVEGLRNDLLLRLERSEIEDARLSVANRDRLLELPGIPRHREATPDEAAAIAGATIPLEQHLIQMGIIAPPAAAPLRRAVAISNRNLGTNHGHLAWQRAASPRCFRIREDPCDYAAYSCLICRRDGTLTIDDLRFEGEQGRVFGARSGNELGDEIEWATFGQQVLRDGRVATFDEIGHHFYDVRHVLAFEPYRSEGENVRQAAYRGYPSAFRDNVKRLWREHGVPRARYFHNALGLSGDAVIVIQREGTIEEIGAALRDAGADDGLILDNGGSVVCWVWWANLYQGGIVSPTVDYRPGGTSAIAFVLKGPVNIEPLGGSISPSLA